MCYSILEIFDLKKTSRPTKPNGVIYEHDELGGTWFDHIEVVRRLHETFDSAIMGAEDPLIEEAKRAEAYFVSRGEGINSVVKSLYNKAKNYGPAMTFIIPIEQGATVSVMVRRYDVRFMYSKNTSAEMKGRISSFLQSFAIGEVEERECKD